MKTQSDTNVMLFLFYKGLKSFLICLKVWLFYSKFGSISKICPKPLSFSNNVAAELLNKLARKKKQKIWSEDLWIFENKYEFTNQCSFESLVQDGLQSLRPSRFGGKLDLGGCGQTCSRMYGCTTYDRYQLWTSW